MKTRFFRIITLFLGLFILLGFTKCDKNTYEGQTIVLLGQESYVVPLDDMIPDTLEVEFKEHLGNLPEGYIPPNIEGEYVISPKKFLYSNVIDNMDSQDAHFRISKQHNRMAKVEINEGQTAVVDTAFIMGNGQNFTLYFIEHDRMEYYGMVFKTDRCVVISGEKTDEGIRNLRMGNIILDVDQSTNPYVGVFSPGWYFIFKDGDGLAENCEWFDNQK